ncbi:MAG: rRNA maturation RNase YbeY [Planctomycetota bacterium]|nr:rRNA maturation RNase YbeY [Planctomycetota bacterium]
MKRRPAGGKAPTFSVLLVKRPGTMKSPAREDVERLLARAWAEVPPRRRPRLEGSAAVSADVIVVIDEEIAELNQTHMRHDGPTDVLSFPMLEFDHEREAFMLGEVVVSSETAQREAQARCLDPVEELSRYIVHGFLHLIGYDDDTEAHAREMEALQERVLAAKD